MTNIPEHAAAENDGKALPAILLQPDTAPSHRDFINGWKVEPQANDRPPPQSRVLTEIATVDASPAAHRSTTRRKHQQMFKGWSQSRHD